VTFNWTIVVATLKKLPVNLAKTVISIGKGRLQPLHPVDKVALWRPDHQVKVIRHNAKPLQNPTAFLTRFEKAFLKRKMSPLVDKQIPTAVPSVDHVINTVFPLNP
jgi:hypothetical protein